MAKPQPGRVQVQVAGPFALFNQALEALLSGLPGITCVDVDLQSLPEACPDLVLLILSQPADLETLITFQQQHPQVRVLLLSMAWTPPQARAALQAGAGGCLSMDVSVSELAAALRQTARGEIALSPELQRAIILEMARSPSKTRNLHYKSLSAREREVLALVCEGLSNKQIAQRLYLSVRTIENHLARMYNKLGVNTRTEAAVLAMQQGWVA